VDSARGPSVAFTVAVSAAVVLAVALVDYATGTELRVFPLYFLPVLAVSLRLGRWPGLGTAAVCALAWGLSNLSGPAAASRPAIGLANLGVMAIAFGSVALLGARERESLRRERAISRTDGLTGLLNGRGFFEAAAVELARSARYRRSLTVAYLDLDDFKRVNDLYGHARGDAILAAVAHALRRACRSTDLVGRLGGDEFVILFPETDGPAAEVALSKLRSRVLGAASHDLGKVTASVGAVSFAKAPADVETLVHEADAVMYAVKTAGKNALRCVVYGENQ
jgi:diguanylate cyclase (GGDEF)-like protein